MIRLLSAGDSPADCPCLSAAAGPSGSPSDLISGRHTGRAPQMGHVRHASRVFWPFQGWVPMWVWRVSSIPVSASRAIVQPVVESAGFAQIPPAVASQVAKAPH